MSLIKSAGAGEQSTGFYSHLLDQSLKFDDGKSSALQRTPASAGNQRLWTFSAWAKKSTLDVDGYLLGVNSSSAPEFIKISNSSTDQFEYAYWNGSVYVYQVRATALLRDTSAWYHIVLAVDTAQGTAANRVKFYVNGTQLTDFSISTYPTQNADTRTNDAVDHRIGSGIGGAYYDGYIAEVNFIDGAALTPSSFGETKDGIWIPKDTSGLTFGTNGFHLTFKDDVVSEGFNTALYEGNNSTQSISGVGFSPGFIWAKNRDSGSYHHDLYDYVRGNNLRLNSSQTAANATGYLTFDGDGFSLTSGGGINANNNSHVAWCWEAGGAPTAGNSAGAGATPTAGSVKIDGSNLGSALAGSIAATKLSANTSQGFSIGTFTKGSGTETVAHGLGAAPDWLIVKRTNGTGSWAVYHSANTANPETDYLRLNSTNGTADDATFWGDTAPTSTVFSIGAAFNSGEELVFYAWTEISDYSKFGSYTGNGGSNNAVTGLGFKPAWLMVKRTDTATTYSNWWIQDGTRNPTNVGNTLNIAADTAGAETNALEIDFDSDGFTLQDGSQGSNISGGTYIYMAFADTREAAFFKDVSTNGNHWTPVNLDYRDSVPDTPTNNWCTLNRALSDSHFNTDQLSEGNLSYNEGEGNNGDGHPTATFSVISGKWYWEVQVPSQQNSRAIGFTRTDNIGKGNVELHGSGLSAANSVVGIDLTGDTIDQVDKAGTHTQHASGLTGMANNDIFGFSVDLDGGTFQMYRNGSTYGSSYNLNDLADWQTHGMTPTASGKTYMAYRFNFGQDSSFAGNHATANSNADGNGHGSFAYAPPSGYLALCSQNLPTPDIIDGTENFNTVLYTGDGNSTKSISGVGFSPDWVWVKNRASTYDHALMDSVRGASAAYLSSNNTASESTYGNIYGDFTSFDSDGFSVAEGSDATYPDAAFNQSSEAYVAWNWLAGTAFSNDASATGVGTIDSEGQINTTAGFAILKWAGTGSNGTIAHGLNAAPELIIVKNRGETDEWPVLETVANGATHYLRLNGNYASTSTSVMWNNTAPTSSVFSLGTYEYVNASGENYISYIFHSVEGYSKVGSFLGNGNADGTFVYTGMAVSWLMVKRTDSTGNWAIYDKTRDTTNVMGSELFANLSNAEQSNSSDIDFLSNGFKMRRNYSENNSSGSYIYLAFAEQPQKFSNAR